LPQERVFRKRVDIGKEVMPTDPVVAKPQPFTLDDGFEQVEVE
jgi:hypothetical protein